MVLSSAFGRIQRSAGRTDRKRISLPGTLAALSSGIPDGIHVWPGDLAADGVRSAGAAGRILRAQLSHGGVRVFADADERSVLLERVRIRPLRGAILFSGAGVFPESDGRKESDRAFLHAPGNRDGDGGVRAAAHAA